MFRKTWKQIKILVILVVIIICLPRSIFPNRGGQESDKDDLEYYTRLNNDEKRLGEFRDDEQSLWLKLRQLEVINSSRKRYGARPVQLDILASRVANKMSREAAENNYVGHWDLAGEKPYQRYAFAGGYDHVSENAFGEWTSGKYDQSESSVLSLMRMGHDSFMSERAPNDGHKKNIIGKDHNFVGIGYFVTGNQFRYYEEFIDRYLQFENIPSEVKAGEKTSITVKTDGKRYLYFLVAYYEKFLSPMTPKEITKKGSYSDFSKDEYLQIPAWDLARYRSGTSYTIPLSFTKEGLYYIQIYTDRKEMSRASSLNTKGKTPYSGIVIKVTK